MDKELIINEGKILQAFKKKISELIKNREIKQNTLNKIFTKIKQIEESIDVIDNIIPLTSDYRLIIQTNIGNISKQISPREQEVEKLNIKIEYLNNKFKSYKEKAYFNKLECRDGCKYFSSYCRYGGYDYSCRYYGWSDINRFTKACEFFEIKP